MTTTIEPSKPRTAPCSPGCRHPQCVGLPSMDLLTDEEVRNFTLWGTDREVPAWRNGWRARISAGPHNRPKEPDYGQGETQNERVAWQRGWTSADTVCALMCAEET